MCWPLAQVAVNSESLLNTSISQRTPPVLPKAPPPVPRMVAMASDA